MNCVESFILAFFTSFILILAGGLVYLRVKDPIRFVIGIVTGLLIFIGGKFFAVNSSCSIIVAVGYILGVLIGFLAFRGFDFYLL